MTKQEFRNSVGNAARAKMAQLGLRYQDIVINHSLPYVAIGDYFFAQGESAGELIEIAQKASDKTGLKENTCLVWFLESAGAL